MSVDPELAIEKLAKYRQETKKKSTEATGDDNQPTKPSVVRQFFLWYYSFNAIFTMTLGFLLVFSGIQVYFSTVLLVFVIIVAFFTSTLIFKTIDRLQKSGGRETTIDDVFQNLLLIPLFFGFLPFFQPTTGYIIIHSLLTLSWILQMYFVIYHKPVITSVEKSRGGVVEIEQEKNTTYNKLRTAFTKDRTIMIGISVILALLLSLPVYLS